MSTRTRVEINPNLRVDGDYTIADLDEDVYGDRPMPLETVEVFESTSGLQGRGWVSAVDEAERTVTLLVDWANLDIPKSDTWAAATHHFQSNLWIHRDSVSVATWRCRPEQAANRVSKPENVGR